MREIVEQLLQGKYVYSQRNLDFSTARIEMDIEPGDTLEGSFTIFGPEDMPVEGAISASDIRMELVTDHFSGSPYEVSYRFNAKGLSQGDVLKGEFRIISNQGEYELPFVISVRTGAIASSLGDIRNLFHFTNLAKTDWDEAVRLFYSEEFISVFKGNDARYESLYRGLSHDPDSLQNVEEFLISINKKQPVKYILEQDELEFEYTGLKGEHGIIITKSGWGYNHLFARAEGDFIALDKVEISDDDFNGANARIKLRIIPEALHEGNNFGSIRFFNAFTDLTLPVKVSVNLTGNHITSDYQEKKRLTVQLVEVYERFSCKKITSRAWLTETGKIISKMNAIDDGDLEVRLYSAHYYITAGRPDEGKRILDELKKEVEDAPGDTLYAYYLYLMTLCSREDAFINDVSERIEGLFKRNPEDWRIAWLLLYVSEEYSGSVPRKYLMLSDQYNYGGRSPILYLEAVNLLNEDPAILTKLEDYELSVLSFGAKKGILSLNLIDQIVSLSIRVREYNPRLFKILKACYETRESDEVLEALVSLLIKGGRTDRASFEWYEKGVERQLRITRLYEYYMMSIYQDENFLLPCEISRMVLMYFSYQSDLEYDKNAILYRYIHEHKQDYPELYDTYAPQIEKFLMSQLDKGRTSRDLGYLYKHLLTKQMVDAANASKVLSILYTSEIRIEDERISSVVVVYDKCEGIMRYPVTGGVAYVPLYGSDYCILLADHDDNRYAQSIPYTNTRLMLAGNLSSLAIPYIQKGQENIELFLCDLSRNAFSIDLDNVGRYRDLADSELVRKSVRNDIRNELVRFYYDNDFTRQLAEYLTQIEPDEYEGSRRSEMLELMVMSGLYDKAFEWILAYGTYGIDAKVILKLCVRLLDRGSLAIGPKEMEIAFYAFKQGKYDEQLLNYLLSGYNGTLRQMRDIWKAAEAFGLDTYSICERMIVQMLYCGSYIGQKTDIVKSYVNGGGKTEIEIAYVSQSAFDSFVQEAVVDEYIFERIEKLYLKNIELDEVCYLAYLKYFTGEHKLADNFNADVAAHFLSYLLSRDIYFPFYMEYADVLPDMVKFIDKTMIEYRTKPGAKCRIQYRLDSDYGNEFKNCEMTKMYEGIFVSEFVLFFGEQMQYYITEERDGTETLTESGTIQKSDIVGGQLAGRFNLINDIMIGDTLQDYNTVDTLLAEYYRKDFICERLFTPLTDNTVLEG